MKLDIALIPFGQMYGVLPGLLPYLQRAQEVDIRTSADALLRFFLTGQYLLWLVFDTETMRTHGFFSTEVKHYSQCKMLCIQHCVIEPQHMALLEQRMQELAAQVARSAGCAGIEFTGRLGWKKHARKFGYKLHSATFQKMLEVDHA